MVLTVIYYYCQVRGATPTKKIKKVKKTLDKFHKVCYNKHTVNERKVNKI